SCRCRIAGQGRTGRRTRRPAEASRRASNRAGSAHGCSRPALLRSRREGHQVGARGRARGAMILEVSHRTTYSYGRPVLRSQHLPYVAPRSGPRQPVHRHGLLIEPAPAANAAREDNFGNRRAILTIEERHIELIVHARSTVEVHAPALPAPETTTP